MPYFPVDDQAPFHPKFIAAGNAAIGLWTRAGALCKAHASGGWLSHDAARTIGTAAEIKKLLKVNLWEHMTRDDEPGYVFHDWTDSKGNGTAEEETERRESEKERNRIRQAEYRARKKAEREAEIEAELEARRNGVTNGVSNARRNAPVTTTPSPSPNPTDGLDMTRQPGIRPETTARLWTDQQEISEFVRARAKRAGVVDLGRLGSMLATTVEQLGPLSAHAAVVLIESLLHRARGEVRSVDGYIITCIRQSPDGVRDLYETEDLAAISAPQVGA